jgi:tRNA pseudouridine32 synthase/23S rRNA pseudouridine746 synthase
MNNPFYYTPSARCEEAAMVILKHIQNHPEWHEEVRGGKTFGVLITESETLYAYSGQMLGRYDIEGFVPPVFDYLDEKGYFKIHETEIVNINKEIDRLSASEELHQAREALYEAEKAKPVLPPSRNIDPSSDEYEAYCRQRQFEKGEYRRQKAVWNERVAECRNALQAIQDRITSLKQERKRKSDSLQHWLFEHFVMLNARGEKKNLLDIFSEWAERTGSKCVIPPSGSGECCAPKLLQYAYIKGLKPVEIAEICPSPALWASSPQGARRKLPSFAENVIGNTNFTLAPWGEDARRAGEGLSSSFRPACQSRCKPILDWMLQGLEVEANPLEEPEERTSLPILFENESIIVVDKPEGMLSVPGKSKRKSAFDILREMRPDCPELIMAHRLDMQTSGVLIAAKTMEVYREVQKMWNNKQLQPLGERMPVGQVRGLKTYFALLEGVLPIPVGTKGEISLPLSSDYLNRPCQKVDYENGKEALTIYEVMGEVEMEGQPRTLLKLNPITGRTHQLRVHCAHPDGLGMPILGDDLYGKHAKRLYLHAQEVQITTPAPHPSLCDTLSPKGEGKITISAHKPEWVK